MAGNSQKKKTREFGSVAGRLATATVHLRPYVSVYRVDDGERVQCYGSPEMIAELAPLIGQTVILYGEIVRRRKSGKCVSHIRRYFPYEPGPGLAAVEEAYGILSDRSASAADYLGASGGGWE
ncbi:MAG: hypothetical protein O3A46_05535 [Candidatus Poribacteria bacterium]|nr:hypothetical protein [Candidatus Poribacteria bacterium]